MKTIISIMFLTLSMIAIGSEPKIGFSEVDRELNKAIEANDENGIKEALNKNADINNPEIADSFQRIIRYGALIKGLTPEVKKELEFYLKLGFNVNTPIYVDYWRGNKAITTALAYTIGTHCSEISKQVTKFLMDNGAEPEDRVYSDGKYSSWNGFEYNSGSSWTNGSVDCRQEMDIILKNEENHLYGLYE